MQGDLEKKLVYTLEKLQTDTKNYQQEYELIVSQNPDLNSDEEIEKFADQIIDGLRDDLANCVRMLDEAYAKTLNAFDIPRYMELLGLSAKQQFRSELDKAFRKERIKLDNIDRRINKIASSPPYVVLSKTLYAKIPIYGQSSYSALEKIAGQMGYFVKRFNSEINEWVERAAMVHSGAITDLRVTYVQGSKKYKETCCMYEKRLDKLIELINLERDKLGIDRIS